MVVPEADGPPPLVNTIMSWPMAPPTATLEPTPTAQDEADQQARDTAETAAENESEPSSQSSANFTIVTAQRDARLFRGLELDNGMRLVLVSDPKAEVAGASLDVHVGSYSDPDDLPGLAHFCEHMLFLASKKYPEEDGYFEFLRAHGGFANAFTASTHTNYFFGVQPTSLEEALDRLAQFFVSPVFAEGQVAREVLAVNSENDKNLQSDGNRKDQVLRSLSSKEFPYHKYGCGTNQSLNVPNITGRLSDWYHEHYGAHVMALTIASNHSLDELQEWAEKSFKPVPSRNAVVPSWSDAPRPFPNSDLPRGYLVKPVMHAEQLSVTFELPGLEAERAGLPIRFLSNLLGHEANGSLTSVLAERGLAEGVSADTDESEADLTMFSIEVALTKKGVKKWDKVLVLVFEALAVAREGVTDGVYDVLRQQQNLTFEFGPLMDAPANIAAVDLSTNAQLFWPPREVLTGPNVASRFDSDLILGLLERMKPKHMIMMLFSTSLTEGDDAWNVPLAPKLGKRLTEKWYGTKHQQLDLTKGDLFARCSEAFKSTTKTSVFRPPPEANPYMPSSFEMLDKSALAPTELELNKSAFSNGVLFHKVVQYNDKPHSLIYVEFRLPKLAAVTTNIKRRAETVSGSASLRAKSGVQPDVVVISDLYARMVGEQLREMSYMASTAGIYCKVDTIAGRGYTLKCQGFSDTLPRYARSVLASLVQFEPDPVRFETQAAQLKNAYEDGMRGRGGATALAGSHTDRLLYRIAFLPSELAGAFEGVLLSDLTEFSNTAFADAEAEAIVLGNINRTAASYLATTALDKVRSRDFSWGADLRQRDMLTAQPERVRQAVVNLHGKFYVHALDHPNPDEKNCAVQLTVQLGQLGLRKAAAAILLGDILSQPFFGSLRTEQQLGYIASGYQTEARGVYSLVFVVQSSVATPTHVTDAMHVFLNGTLADVLAKMKPAKFDGYVAAAKARLLQKPTSLIDEGERLWPRMIDESYDFTRDHDLASVLEQGLVTLDDVRALHGRALKPDETEGGRMLVWVIPQSGAASEAMPTQKTAPAGYSLTSVESSVLGVASHGAFQEGKSYYPQVAAPKR